jgi:hypothetical protein
VRNIVICNLYHYHFSVAGSFLLGENWNSMAEFENKEHETSRLKLAAFEANTDFTKGEVGSQMWKWAPVPLYYRAKNHIAYLDR